MLQMLTPDVKDLISTICQKWQFKLARIMHQVNDLLKDECKGNNFHFVFQYNANIEYLLRDCIHCNNEYTCIFAGSLDCVNDFILTFYCQIQKL